MRGLIEILNYHLMNAWNLTKRNFHHGFLLFCNTRGNAFIPSATIPPDSTPTATTSDPTQSAITPPASTLNLKGLILDMTNFF